MSVKVVLRWFAGAIAVCFVAAAAVLVPSLVTPALAPGGDELVVPPVVAQAEVQARVAAEARLQPQRRAPRGAAPKLRAQVARPAADAVHLHAPGRPQRVRPRPAAPTVSRAVSRPSPQPAPPPQERREEANADDHGAEAQPRVLLAQRAKPADATRPHAKAARGGKLVDADGASEHEGKRKESPHEQEAAEPGDVEKGREKDTGRCKDEHEDAEKE